MGKEHTSRPVAEKISTRIWAEVDVDTGNGQVEEATLCHGYDFYKDLLGTYNWNELTLLLLQGELPGEQEAAVLDVVMASLINPGPRHWATQAAMTTAVANATVGNSLLAGLAVLQGRYTGGLAVEQEMEMFQQVAAEMEGNKEELFDHVLTTYPDLPGYGLHYHQRDMRAVALVQAIEKMEAVGRHLRLALQLEGVASARFGKYLTLTGAVSAILSDIQCSPVTGHGLFLIAAGPGLLAHLLEQRQGNWASFPFYPSPHYSGPRDEVLQEEQRAYNKDL